MGEVIRRNAAASDIKGDITSAHTNAKAKGGAWQTLAEERIGTVVAVLQKVDADLSATKATLAPLVAAINVIDDEADQFLGELSDELWNKLKRPGNDPFFSLLFPGGIMFYTDGDDEGQPDRMLLLAELLEAGVHPKLDADVAKNAAVKVRAKAASYKEALDAAHGPRTKVKLLEKMEQAVVRSAQMELAKLKRRYLAEGFSEAEIHQVIPDRPRAKGKSAEGPPPAPATP